MSLRSSKAFLPPPGLILAKALLGTTNLGVSQFGIVCLQQADRRRNIPCCRCGSRNVPRCRCGPTHSMLQVQGAWDAAPERIFLTCSGAAPRTPRALAIVLHATFFPSACAIYWAPSWRSGRHPGQQNLAIGGEDKKLLGLVFRGRPLLTLPQLFYRYQLRKHRQGWVTCAESQKGRLGRAPRGRT